MCLEGYEVILLRSVEFLHVNAGWSHRSPECRGLPGSSKRSCSVMHPSPQRITWILVPEVGLQKMQRSQKEVSIYIIYIYHYLLL